MTNKVVLTIESNDPSFVSRIMQAVTGREEITVALPPLHILHPSPLEPQPPVTTEAAPAGAAMPRQRKPRADAGKPRGPYKSTGVVAEGASPNTASPAEPASAATAPTNSEAPVASPTATPTTASAAPVASEPGKELTIDDARAALKRISDTKGLGMEACMTHLQEFGVTRISDLKAPDYALFVKQADQKVAERA